MICDNCKNKPICKNYDYLLEHSELIINNCTLKSLEKQKDNVIRFNPSIVFTEEHTLNNNNNENTNIESKKPIEIIKCPTCNCKTFDEDIKECCICGKLTCSVCGCDTVDPNAKDEDFNVKRICNKCYGTNDEDTKNESSFKTVLLNSIKNGDDE